MADCRDRPEVGNLRLVSDVTGGRGDRTTNRGPIVDDRTKHLPLRPSLAVPGMLLVLVIVIELAKVSA
jgi:hypothetical protein